jgi:hypothetical protein
MPVMPVKLAGWRIEPPVSVPVDAGIRRAATAAADGDSAEDEPAATAPRVRRTLGSLDTQSPAGMLVTLTSRGGAVERIELAGHSFHDQDDRSGYLGHLAVEPVPGEGCRIGIVGSGTPAEKAGLRQGDVIARVGGAATPDSRSLRAALATTHPGQTVAIDILRAGQTASHDAVLGRRPLEVVRPEYRTQPVLDPDAEPCDPFSFRLSLETRDGGKRSEPLLEIPGQELSDRDWQSEAAADGSYTGGRIVISYLP